MNLEYNLAIITILIIFIAVSTEIVDSSTYVVKGDNNLRIIKHYGSYYPQKNISGIWTNILCTTEAGWYRVPLFTGYGNLRDAEINIECAKKYDFEHKIYS